MGGTKSVSNLVIKIKNLGILFELTSSNTSDDIFGNTLLNLTDDTILMTLMTKGK